MLSGLAEDHCKRFMEKKNLSAVSKVACIVFMYYFRPTYPTEEMEEEVIMEDDAELTLNKVEEITAVGICNHLLLLLFLF